MFKNNNSDFSYERDESFDHIIEEKGNTFIALRRIKWNGGDYKYDLRRWYNGSDGNEVMGKGISLTDDGMHELSKTLVENNFGYTEDLVKAIKTREDFVPAMLLDENGIPTNLHDDLIDPETFMKNIFKEEGEDDE